MGERGLHDVPPACCSRSCLPGLDEGIDSHVLADLGPTSSRRGGRRGGVDFIGKKFVYRQRGIAKTTCHSRCVRVRAVILWASTWSAGAPGSGADSSRYGRGGPLRCGRRGSAVLAGAIVLTSTQA